MSGQEFATRTPQQELVERVRSEDFQQQIALALPDGVSPRRFGRALVTALLQNPDLAQVPDKGSLFAALIRAAQDGLVPDGRQAALVRRGDKAVYHPMIGGFQQVCADHGWTLRTQVVYANDEFDFTEQPPTITHRPVRPGQERGDLIAAYAVATHRDGRREQHVLYPEDVAMRRAKATTQAVWKEWTPQMWAKSAGRALFKELPITDRDRVERVIAGEEDEGESARALYGPDGDRFLTTPARVVPPVDGAEPGEANGTDRQAEGPEDPSPPGPSAPEPDPDPEPGADEHAVAAGTVKVPSGQHAGKTIAEVHALGSTGIDWLGWALKPERPWQRDQTVFAQALNVYVAAFLPELVEGQAAA